MTPPKWLEWAREIQALAQIGTHYADNDFDQQRYKRLNEIAAEIISEHSNLDYSNSLTIFKTPVGYATPRIDVRGAVFSNSQILLVRERSDGGWALPGGWADVGDIPSNAVEREVLEETGYYSKTIKVIGVYDANRAGSLELFHAYKLIFLCELLGGEPTPSVETTEVAFFNQTEIPDCFSAQRTDLRHIQDAFLANQQQNCPTVFD